MYGNFQISAYVKDILSKLNKPEEMSKLDYSTINFYKIKLINEMDRLYKVLPEVPQTVQDEIKDELISQLEGAYTKLSSITPCGMSSLKTLVRRLDSIGK